VALAHNKKHYPHFVEDAIVPENIDLWTDNLFIGAMWRLCKDISPVHASSYGRNVAEHELHYVVASAWSDTQKRIAKDSIAIYTGTTRVTEISQSHGTVSVLRHTFLVNCVRYMTINLNLFEPVI
jgi:hypothetical protein